MNRLLSKRLGQPEDITYCALYLASDESTWATDANFSIDGGVTATYSTGLAEASRNGNT